MDNVWNITFIQTPIVASLYYVAFKNKWKSKRYSVHSTIKCKHFAIYLHINKTATLKRRYISPLGHLNKEKNPYPFIENTGFPPLCHYWSLSLAIYLKHGLNITNLGEEKGRDVFISQVKWHIWGDQSLPSYCGRDNSSMNSSLYFFQVVL